MVVNLKFRPVAYFGKHPLGKKSVDKGEGGVKNSEKIDDVLYGRPLFKSPNSQMAGSQSVGK